MDSAIPHRSPFVGIARRALFVTVLLCAPRVALAQTAPPDSGRSASEGAYTTAQAAEGEIAFTNICGACHASSQFNGPAFRKNWTGRRVYDFFDQLRNTMPLDNPGGLSSTDYAAVIAYILKLNQYPAGTSALPVSDAELKRIRF